MSGVLNIIKRELKSYFSSPVAYVFLVIYLLLSGFCTFMLGGFFRSNEASMDVFFTWQPWLCIVLVPAIGMRTWAEEHRLGTLELLFTSPLTVWQAVIGKFLAGWIFLVMAFALTFPMPWALCVLGEPDWGPVVTGYLGCVLMSGACLALACACSSCTRNQVVSFILALVLCLLLLLAGFPPVTALLLNLGLWNACLEALANFSLGFHFESLLKGVLDLRDLLYFAALIVFFLYCTVVVLNSERRRSSVAPGVSVLALLLALVLLGYVLRSVNVRVDCTANSIYSLSQTTREVLAGLEEDVQLRFYYSRNMRDVPVGFKNYASRIGDLLKEYENFGGGRLRVEKLNPMPDTDSEDAASLDGIPGQTLRTGGVERFYLGIAMRCGDRQAAIPFLSPDNGALLEYELTRTLLAVSRSRKPRIGVISDLKIFGGISDNDAIARGNGGLLPAWHFIAELKKNYDVLEISQDKVELPPDLSMLLLVHPRKLNAEGMAAIEKHVQGGGKVLACLDAMSLVELQSQRRVNRYAPVTGLSSNLAPLLDKWGVKFEEERVVADRLCMTSMKQNGNSMPMPTVLSLKRENMNPDDPATAYLHNLQLLNCGSFQVASVDGLKSQMLLRSSAESRSLPLYVTQQRGEDILRSFKPEGKPKCLALRLTGVFPGGIRESSVLLVGDSDWLYDAFCLQQVDRLGQKVVRTVNDNLAMLGNMLETLSGDVALFGIRSRAAESRPFLRLQKMEQQATLTYQEQLRKFEESWQCLRKEMLDLQKDGEDAKLFQEQKSRIMELKRRELELRGELKALRKNMRRDILRLENRIMLLNMGLVPGLVILLGLCLGLRRRIFRRRRRHGGASLLMMRGMLVMLALLGALMVIAFALGVREERTWHENVTDYSKSLLPMEFDLDQVFAVELKCKGTMFRLDSARDAARMRMLLADLTSTRVAQAIEPSPELLAKLELGQEDGVLIELLDVNNRILKSIRLGKELSQVASDMPELPQYGISGQNKVGRYVFCDGKICIVANSFAPVFTLLK